MAFAMRLWLRDCGCFPLSHAALPEKVGFGSLTFACVTHTALPNHADEEQKTVDGCTRLLPVGNRKLLLRKLVKILERLDEPFFCEGMLSK